MPISRTLDLSTHHVTTTDADVLDELAGYGGGHPPASHPLSVHPHATGWIVRMFPLDDERRAQAKALGLSEFFLAVVARAQAEDAMLIRFDRAALYEPGLPTFARLPAKPEIEPAPREGSFYRTRFSIDVLSEDPLEEIGLAGVAHAIVEGDCVGGPLRTAEHRIAPKVAARLLREFGSEPGFFRLDEEGRRVDDVNDDQDAAPSP